MKAHPLASTAVVALAVVVLVQVTLFSFDVIHVGDRVLDDKVPGFVFVVLAALFWGGVLVLVGTGVAALRRRRSREARNAPSTK